VINNIKKP